MTEAATVVETPAPTPAPEQIETGEMTPGERAYFESRGQDVSGLGLPNGSQEPTGTPQTAETQSEATPVPENAETGSEEDLEAGEITIDEQGRARDAKTGKFIPKAVALEWKKSLKEEKRTNETLRDQVTALRERLAILTEALPKPEQQEARAEEEAAPDPETDVLGYMRWQAKRLEELEKRLQDTSTETKATLEQQRLKDAFVADVQQFSRSAPDFMNAINHAIQVRDKMLEVVGHSDPNVRQQMIMREIADLTKEAVAAKQSPAQKLYELAKVFGYQPAQQKTAEDEKKAAALAELDRIKQGQLAAASLRGAGTPGVGSTIGPAEWADMDEGKASEFRRDYIAKNGREAWSAFLAGRR